MTSVAFKAASCGAVLCGLWLAILLTALWPFGAAYTLVWGSDELKQGMPSYGICWAFNVAALFFLCTRRCTRWVRD